MLKIRVSRSYDDLKQFCQKLADACDVCVVYEHEADASVSRTHIHAFVENPKVSTDTMKNWVKKDLNTKSFPKADWAFTSANDRGFITYMSNGHLIPKFFKGIEKSELDLLQTAWVSRSERPQKTQYVLKNENPEQQRLRQWQMVEEIRKRFTNGDPDTLVQLIIQVVMVENRTICGRYKIRDYFDTVMATRDPQGYACVMQKFCLINNS